MHVPLIKPVTTTEELLALPDDGVDRDLIRGEIRENPMTQRSLRHTRAMACVTFVLKTWRSQQPPPRGEVLTGEVGFRIRRDPDTTVGIDVAYISPELASKAPQDIRVIDGLPTLAVEILSPSNTWQEVTDKLRDYLDAGVPLVWVLDPVFRTAMVYRPEAEPELFNFRQELSAEPHLPGFRVTVAQLFAD
jgi:Uma2 family endonuclease